jgi:hypothetical protein
VYPTTTSHSIFHHLHFIVAGQQPPNSCLTFSFPMNSALSFQVQRKHCTRRITTIHVLHFCSIVSCVRRSRLGPFRTWPCLCVYPMCLCPMPCALCLCLCLCLGLYLCLAILMRGNNFKKIMKNLFLFFFPFQNPGSPDLTPLYCSEAKVLCCIVVC